MTNRQRISTGFPFPVYVNEANNKQALAPTVYVNQTGTAPTPPTTNGTPTLLMMGV